MEWRRFQAVGPPSDSATIKAWAYRMFLELQVSLRSLPVQDEVTTDELTDATSPVNTIGKYAGRQVYNSTTGLPLWAAGGGGTDTWDDASGVTQQTPT